MKLLDEIRRQPSHIRKIFMWCMVVITFSVVGLTYVNSTRRQIVALMNPQESSSVEEPTAPQRSPFALVGDMVASLRANISGIFSGGDAPSAKSDIILTPVSPQKLP